MKQEQLEQKVLAKLEVENLYIGSDWNDIVKVLSRTVAPNKCLDVARKLRNRVGPRIMQYSNELIVKNLEALPGGIRCNYLIVISGQNSDLIAKAWKRKKPVLQPSELLVIF